MPSDAAVVTAFTHVDWIDRLEATSYDPAVARRLVVAGVPRAEIAELKSAVRREVGKVPSVREIAHSIAFYDELSEPPGSRLRLARDLHQQNEQDAVRRTIRDFLKGRTFVVEDEAHKTILCPLFTLSGPGSRGSKATWTSSVEKGDKTGWEMTVFGAGVGRDTSLSVSRSTKLICVEREAKGVSLRVPVRLRKIATLRHGVREGEGLSAEVQPLHPGAEVPIVVRSVSERRQPGRVVGDEPYDLRGDHSNSSTTFTIAVTEGRDSTVNVGLSAYGLRIGAQIAIHRSVKTTLEVELTPGTFYQLLWLSNPSGVRWTVKGEAGGTHAGRGGGPT
jgi:hypothetical protein